MMIDDFSEPTGLPGYIDTNLNQRRLAQVGEHYVQIDAYQPDPRPLFLRWLEHFDPRPIQAVLRYRVVVVATPWLVIYRDDDPTAPSVNTPLKSAWASQWADYVPTCACVSRFPLEPRDVALLLNQRPSAKVTTVIARDRQELPEGEGSYAVSNTPVPIDEDDGWDEDWTEETRA